MGGKQGNHCQWPRHPHPCPCESPQTSSLLPSSPAKAPGDRGRPHLDLGLLPARRWLVNGHFDGLLVIGHHDGPQRAVLRVHLRVIHGPETVELQVLQVPVGGGRKGTMALLLAWDLPPALTPPSRICSLSRLQKGYHLSHHAHHRFVPFLRQFSFGWK